MNLTSILAPTHAAGYAAAGSVARSVRQLGAEPNTMQAPAAQAGGSAALAAGILAFAAVGVIVTLRIVFKGAVS